METKDIQFTLDQNYDKKIINNIENYYSRVYIYDFNFKLFVNNNNDSIKNIVIYKNGIQYSDIIVTETQDNNYTISDKNIIRKGNFNFRVEITLNSNKTYSNNFNLKITNSYIENDIDIISFSTQGLHENYNNLNIILNLNSKYNIDVVELYRKRINYDWKYLGLMIYESSRYEYKDLIFDVNMTEDEHYLYKVIINTSNNLFKEKIISTLIKCNTFSLNNIFIENVKTKKEYDIFGGIVGRINNELCEFNNDIFEFIVNKSDNEYISINIDSNDKSYYFYGEEFKTIYQDEYITNQTNVNPNIFEFNGKGIIKYVNNNNRISISNDTCTFNIRLICGDTFSVIIDIIADNINYLSINSNKAVNNIVKYIDNDKSKILNCTYEDNTIANVMYDGILTYNNDELDFLDINDLSNIKISLIEKSEKYFKQSTYITNNEYYAYFITYNNDNITFIKYDGINYDTYKLDVDINNSTLDFIRNTNIFKFDSNYDLIFNFYIYDYIDNIKRVYIKDDEIVIIDYSEKINIIYNLLKNEIINYALNLTELDIIENNEELICSCKVSETYDILEKNFINMNYENFVQNFTMNEFKYKFKFGITISKPDITTGMSSNLNTEIYITGKYSTNISDSSYIIEAKNIISEINDEYFLYNYDTSVNNQNPSNIMEKLNNNYYVKFENSISSKNYDDYGIYKNCNLYNKSVLIATLSLNVIYGSDYTNYKYFKYKDCINIRILVIDYNTILIINMYKNKLIITKFDTSKNEVIKSYEIHSNLIPGYILNLTESQIGTFEKMFISEEQYSSITREMLILSTSDNKDNLNVEGITNNLIAMKQIDQLNSNNDNKTKSFKLRYEVSWPLNIKNRNDYLDTINIT